MSVTLRNTDAVPSSSMVTSSTGAIVGGSLTEETVKTKLVVSDRLFSSVIYTVIVEIPCQSGSGVNNRL